MAPLVPLAVLAAALAAFAGAYEWSTLPLTGLTLIAALAVGRRAFALPRATRLADLALAGAVAVVALQLVPLPPEFTARLSPRLARVAAALRVGPAPATAEWRPLTLDAAATRQALLVLASTILVFFTTRAALESGGIRRLCRGLAGLGAVLAIAAVIQRAATPGLVFGFWAPLDPGARPFGPFVNRNHFAAWMLLAVPVVAGYLVAHIRIHLADARTWRDRVHLFAASGGPLLAAAVMAMGLALLATLSRSALLGLGAAAVAAWLLSRGRRARNQPGAGTVLAVAGAALVVLLAFVDVDAWATRFDATLASSPTDRAAVWRESMPVVADFPIAGTGAGTYGFAMLVYQQSDRHAYFNQAHSHYLQVAVEGGALLLLCLMLGLAGLARAGRHALASDRSEVFWIRVGAAGSLVGIAVQSIWETALRMPADAYLCAVVAALLLHTRTNGGQGYEPSPAGGSNRRGDDGSGRRHRRGPRASRRR
ncbi:MAG: O-antigen ligase family protein [Acidobacteriota bacterium]